MPSDKRRFVPDENVVILAGLGEDDHGNEDDTCMRLLLTVRQRCHSFALCSVVEGKLSGQADRWRGRPAIPGAMRVIKATFFDKGKDCRYITDSDLPDLQNLRRVKEADRPFVQLTAAVGGVLVTTDGGLLAAVSEEGWDASHGFSAMRPEEASRLAGDP